MNDLLKLLGQQKGANSFRTVLLVVCFYVAVKVNDIDKRVAVLEARASAMLAESKR